MYADLTVPSRFLPFPHGSGPFSHGSVTVPVLIKHLQILVEPQTGASFSFSIADRAQAHSYYSTYSFGGNCARMAFLQLITY